MWAAVAIGGAALVTGYMGAQAQSEAADTAAQAQGQASAAQIAESRRQFDTIQKILAPYSQAGQKSLQAQQALLGLSGQEAQQAAISGIENSPAMAAMLQQGENAMLQNASATGGLRGGNLQQAMATFRPQLLNQLMQQQYGNLGGLTSIGQNAAAGTGNAASNMGGQINSALQQQGAAQAGSALAQGQAAANMWGGIGQTVGTLGTLKLMKAF